MSDLSDAMAALKQLALTVGEMREETHYLKNKENTLRAERDAARQELEELKQQLRAKNGNR